LVVTDFIIFVWIVTTIVRTYVTNSVTSVIVFIFIYYTLESFTYGITMWIFTVKNIKHGNHTHSHTENQTISNRNTEREFNSTRISGISYLRSSQPQQQQQQQQQPQQQPQPQQPQQPQQHLRANNEANNLPLEENEFSLSLSTFSINTPRSTTNLLRKQSDDTQFERRKNSSQKTEKISDNLSNAKSSSGASNTNLNGLLRNSGGDSNSNIGVSENRSNISSSGASNTNLNFEKLKGNVSVKSHTWSKHDRKPSYEFEDSDVFDRRPVFISSHINMGNKKRSNSLPETAEELLIYQQTRAMSNLKP
jgi:hypothetical protein